MIRELMLLSFGRIVAAVLLTGPGLAAQHHAPVPAAHDSLPTSTSVTDGAVNPQQIPDSVAYMLFFTAASEQPGSGIDEKARQRAFLASAGLSDQEISRVAVVLSQFRKQMADMGKSRGTPPTSITAAEDREALVASTRAALANCLGQLSKARIDQFVQAEKRKMRMTAQSTNP